MVSVAEHQVHADVWVDATHPSPSHHFYRVLEFSLDRQLTRVVRHQETVASCPALSRATRIVGKCLTGGYRRGSDPECSGLTRSFVCYILRYMANYSRRLLREFMNAVKALGDENRVRALMALRASELCVCQITELLGLAPSTVSKHMSILKQARLVDTRKSGRWVFYRLAGNKSAPEVQEAIAWLCKSLSKDTSVRQDERRLKEILKIDITVLCSEQGKKLNDRCIK